MNAEKQNWLNFFSVKPIEEMPFGSSGLKKISYPLGWQERVPGDTAGVDWFGCEWVESLGTSTPAPNRHVLEDICDWREKVQFPDLEAWDWEGLSAQDGVADIDYESQFVIATVCTGLWERMHVMMGFENALCALLEEPEEVEALLDALVDHRIKVFEKIKKYYNPDVITHHDDFGTQRAMFFSPDLWRELFKEREKKLVDAVHGMGMRFMLHSCGKFDEIIPDIAEIGVDVLQCMDINDISRALEVTNGKMNFQVSAHTQEFSMLNDSGALTEEYVRETVRREFNEWGKTGHYMVMSFPVKMWYDQIVYDEYEACRKALKGTYGA